MGNQIPKAKLKDTYTLNGTTYKSNLDLTKVTAAQFIDYQNYVKEQPLCYKTLCVLYSKRLRSTIQDMIFQKFSKMC